MLPGIAGVVLAGGKSRRMGKDKRGISIHGKPLLDRTVTVLLEVFSEVLLVLAEPEEEREQERVKIVTDIIPGCAAAGGLYTGLYYSLCPRVFVVACDMPFLQPAVIEFFSTRSPQADVVLAQLANGFQPMHGVYSKKCLPFLRDMLDAQELRVQRIANHRTLNVHLISESELIPLDPQLLSFMNLNSPADVEFAKKINPI